LKKPEDFITAQVKILQPW